MGQKRISGSVFIHKSKRKWGNENGIFIYGFLFLFLPAVLLIYYNPIVKTRTFRNVFLLLASLAFYAWGEPIFVFLMILSIFITWYIGLKIQKKHNKGTLTAGVCYHILVLFIFKYLTFAATEVGLLIHKDMSFISISLPIGISFFTFQLMSYLFDIYYGTAEAQSNPLYVGLYVSLFPQLIAGPIVRYKQVAEEISNRRESYSDIVDGMERFIYGLGKKVLIANYMAQIADNVFDYLPDRSVAMAWLGAVAYALQIYFDFSGYSDMAIGLGRMFGFHFDENFNYPYISKSVTEFWRRWHISLSSWFRDYVYIPLGGNRVKKSRWVFNLAVVWILTGIWHGANWTFVLWGGVYCIILLIEKIIGFTEKIGIFSHIYTMVVVMLAWVIFRSGSIAEAWVYIGQMFGVGASGGYDSAISSYLASTKMILIAAIIGSGPLLKKICEWLNRKNIGWIEQVWLVFIFILSTIQVVGSTYNPFIYFNF